MSMNQPMGSSGRPGHTTDAKRLKERFDWLESFSDDELTELRFLNEGDPMGSDDEYFDISNPETGILTGTPGQRADEGSRYVAKSQIPSELWDQLVGPFI